MKYVVHTVRTDDDGYEHHSDEIWEGDEEFVQEYSKHLAEYGYKITNITEVQE